MNKFIVSSVALVAAIICIVASVASASGYGAPSMGYGAPSYGHQQSYGQNYERKTGFKTTIYHPYGGVSNRFDYRTFPAYGNSYNSHPAPYIKTGLDYTIGDSGYGQHQSY